VAESPDRLAPMRHAAATWAQRYSLEGLRDALRDLMKEWWEPAGSGWPAARASREFAE
jgi:hypothetical protein